ncbi:TonB-dependent receptor [Sphingomonas koreensis]|nr:TonB-dependent receptor [Sphingomonas koreensis]
MIATLGLAFVAAALWLDAAPAPQASPPPAAKPDDKTITVTGRRAPVERTIEGNHYDERTNPQGQAGSATNILRTIPSVGVGADGGLTVRGNGDVKVYINGRPTASGDPVSLQAIPGSSIASVDVITNPSAEYDANGSVIVNLTLKKGARDGVHSTEIANTGSRGQTSISVDTSYGSKALLASLNLSVSDNVPVMRNTASTTLFDTAGTATRHFATRSIYDNDHRQSASVESSLGYDLDAASDIGMDVTYTLGRPLDIVREHHVDDDGDGATNIYDRVRGGSYRQNAHDISLHYERRGAGRRASLKVLLQDSRRRTVSDRLFTTSYGGSSQPSSTERVLNRWISATRLASLDFGKAIGGGVALSGGGEWRRDESPAFNRRGAADPIDFDASQQTSAAYLSAEAKSGTWTVQTGGRYEYVRLDTLLRSVGDRRRRGYAAFNDSVSIARALGHDQLMFKASRAKQTISHGDLNPATVYIDAQNLAVGDPDLAPQTVSSVEAEYDHSRGSLDGAFTVYVRHVSHTIDDLYRFRPDNIVVRTKQNGGPSNSLGATLTLSDTIFRSLAYSTAVNVFRSELSVLGLPDRATEAKLSYALQGSLDWTLSHADTLHLDGEVNGPTLVPQGTQSGTSSLDVIYTHTFSPSLSATLTFRGLLEQMHVRTTVSTGQAISVRDAFTSRRAVMIGLRYKAF